MLQKVGSTIIRELDMSHTPRSQSNMQCVYEARELSIMKIFIFSVAEIVFVSLAQQQVKSTGISSQVWISSVECFLCDMPVKRLQLGHLWKETILGVVCNLWVLMLLILNNRLKAKMKFLKQHFIEEKWSKQSKVLESYFKLCKALDGIKM